MTGLSGAGKTTIGTKLYNYLKSKDNGVILFDGDALRSVYQSTDYSDEGRMNNARMTNRLCKLLTDQDLDVICCIVGMNEDIRKLNRDTIENYYEIYLKVDIDELIRRDQKQLYSRALRGEIEHLPGINMDFDEPHNPDIVIENYGDSDPDDALKMIKKNQGTEVDIRTIDLHDPKTCRMLCKGDTAAVFQMESDGMTRLMKQLAPEGFEDLIPLVALYRPGPLGSGMAEDFIAGRHGRRTAQVLHPLMEPIVADTYGVILYQEQVMQIVSALGGFTLGEADILRRAMGKKKAKLLDSMKEKFLDGAQKLHGISRELGSEIFALLQHFAGYGFNKSHSAAYALVAYHTAWLKANYPVEYMAAFLNSIITVADKVSWYIGVCRDMGIQVLPPDINTSEAGFSVDGHTIRFGLGAIKSVGDAAVTVILEERKKRGPFRDFFDFTRRVDLSKVNKRVVEALIKCGSMNGFGLRRSQLLAIMDPALEAAASEQRDRITGQLGLFGEEDIASANTIPIPNLPEIPKAEILRLERELIGFYVTGHPLDAYRNALRRLTPLIRCTEENYKDGERIAVGGIITDLRLRSTKNGDRMASFVLEDLTGSLTVIAFPRAYAASRANIDKDRIVMIQGILKLDEEQARIFANRVEPLQEAAKEVHLHIGPGKNTQAVQQQLGGIFAAFHGKNPVYLHVADTKKVIRTNPRFWVDLDAPGFADAIERVLGKGSMEL